MIAVSRRVEAVFLATVATITLAVAVAGWRAIPKTGGISEEQLRTAAELAFESGAVAMMSVVRERPETADMDGQKQIAAAKTWWRARAAKEPWQTVIPNDPFPLKPRNEPTPRNNPPPSPAGGPGNPKGAKTPERAPDAPTASQELICKPQ